MEPEEFERLATLTRMRGNARIMARRVLVDGLSAAAAARELGKHRSEASRAVKRIEDAALQEHICPRCGRPFIQATRRTEGEE